MQVAGSFKVDSGALAEIGHAIGTNTGAATLIRALAIARAMAGHMDTNGVLTFVLPDGTLKRFQLRD